MDYFPPRKQVDGSSPTVRQCLLLSYFFLMEPAAQPQRANDTRTKDGFDSRILHPGP